MGLKMKWDIGNKVLSTVPTLLRTTIGCGILTWPTLILLPPVTKALKTLRPHNYSGCEDSYLNINYYR